ncbi:MAG: hypothetical protein MSH60_08170 [Ruminococcus sp.]|nr:hypothetical protein [Ruminococcus sp.]
MIKGVNRRVIEINSTESDYFEKAVLYLRPGSDELPPKLLNDEAASYLQRITGSRGRRRVMTAAEIAGLSSALTAVVTLIVMTILFTM